MKFLPHALALVVAAGLGLAVGFAWKGRSRPDTLSKAGNEPSPVSASSLERQKTVAHDDSPLATQLAHDLALSPPVAQWLCWMTALEKAQAPDFPRLAKMAHDKPAIWRCVIRRWVQIAPRHLFDTLVASAKYGGALPVDELSRELFDQWARTDLEAAVAALNEPGDLGRRKAWQMQVATVAIDAKPERGLELMWQWHIENYLPRMEAVNVWAAADPRHAAEFALAHPAGVVSQQTMDAVGRAWARTDPQAALSFAAAQPNELGARLAASVLQTWAGQNLSAAAEWLAGADESTRTRLSPAFLESWAKQDSAGALAWCQENLAGPQLALAVSGVLRGVAAQDVAGAATIVSAMQPGPARSAAATVVALKWFPELFSGGLVKAETVAWLSSLDSDSIRQALSQVAWNWASTDPKGMAEFLRAANNEQVPPFADGILARQMARTSPIEALDWAASLPASRAMEAARPAFAEWQQAQPETALAWVEALPASDPRRQPFFETLVQTLAAQPQAPQRFATLSRGDQALAQEVIAKMSLPEAQKAKLMDSLTRTHPR